MIYPPFIDHQVRALAAADGDMTWCDSPTPLLEGQGVLSVRALRWVAAHSTHPDDHEHVGSRYLADHPEEFRIIGLSLPGPLQDARWRVTVDEEADYALIAALYASLWKGRPIPLEEAVAWLEANPEIALSNRQVQHQPVNRELSERRQQWGQYITQWFDYEKNPVEL